MSASIKAIGVVGSASALARRLEKIYPEVNCFQYLLVAPRCLNEELYMR